MLNGWKALQFIGKSNTTLFRLINTCLVIAVEIHGVRSLCTRKWLKQWQNCDRMHMWHTLVLNIFKESRKRFISSRLNLFHAIGLFLHYWPVAWNELMEAVIHKLPDKNCAETFRKFSGKLCDRVHVWKIERHCRRFSVKFTKCLTL